MSACVRSLRSGCTQKLSVVRKQGGRLYSEAKRGEKAGRAVHPRMSGSSWPLDCDASLKSMNHLLLTRSMPRIPGIAARLM